MFLAIQWRQADTQKIITVGHEEVFTSSYTDYGVCCQIFPQLDFDDPESRSIRVKDYKSLMYDLSSQNGLIFTFQTTNSLTSDREQRMARKTV